VVKMDEAKNIILTNGSNGKTRKIVANKKQKEFMFNSQTWGKVDFERMMKLVFSFIKEDANYNYRLVIGTDSQPNHTISDFVTAVIVNRVGQGGVYFWQRRSLPTF